MTTSDLARYIRVFTAVVDELSTILSLYVDPTSADTKVDALAKSVALFSRFGLQAAEAAKLGAYIVDTVEMVAGGSSAAADVLNDIDTVAATQNITLPPVVVSMISGLLIQIEAAIQALHQGK